MSPQSMAARGRVFDGHDAVVRRRGGSRRRNACCQLALCLLLSLALTSSAQAAPSAPSNLIAVPGDRQVTLSWSAAPASQNVAGYNIYKGENWTYIGDASGPRQYVHSGLTNGDAKLYRVQAYTRDAPPVHGPASAPVASAAVGLPPGPCLPAFASFGIDLWPPACWRPYTATHFLNRPVPADPAVHPNSPAIIARMQAMGAPIPLYAWSNMANGNDYYHPVYYSKPTDPLYTVSAVEPWNCEIDERSFRIPALAKRASGTDAHMTVVDTQAGLEYDMWQVKVASLPPAGGRINVGCGGVVSMLDDSDLYATANAGEWGLMGGQITAAELRAGRIDHALVATVQCSAPTAVRPAGLNSTGFTCPVNASSAPAIGQHLWLQMSTTEIEALAMPAWKKTIMRALARYGAIVGDNGGGPNAFGLQLESDMSQQALGRAGKVYAYAAELKAAGTPGVSQYLNDYKFDMATGFPWSRMRVLTPPAS